MLHPQWYEVIIGCLAVIAGCVGSAWAFWGVRHTGNWLLLLVGAGSALAVIGIVGQQAPAGTGGLATPWSATIGIPLLGVSVSGVTTVGLLATLVGLSLVLFFERVVPEEERWRPPPYRPLDEDDSV